MGTTIRTRGPAIALGLGLLLLCDAALAFGTPATLRRGWRWYHDDADQRPSPAAEALALRWGVSGGEILRLRHVINTSGTLALFSSPLNGSTCASNYTSRVDVLPTAPWQLANGLGQFGGALDRGFIDEDATPGLFYERGDFSTMPSLASSGTYEHDFAIHMPRSHFQPALRTSFAVSSRNSGGTFAGAVPCPAPQACTATGAPDLSAPRRSRVNLQIRSGLGIDLEDWDGDGRTDLLVGSGQTVAWHRGLPGGRYGIGKVLNAGGTTAITELGGAVPDAGDWDNDGDLDLVVGSSEGAIYLVENLGTPDAPRLAAPVRGRADGSPLIDGGASVTAQFVDWNDDGRTDILVGTSSGNIMILTPLGPGATAGYSKALLAIKCPAPPAPTIFSTPVRVCRPSTTDWNEDGLKDVFFHGDLDTTDLIPAGLVVHFNTGTNQAPILDSGRQFTVSSFAGSLLGPLRYEDMNGDGIRDIVGINSVPVFSANVSTADTPTFAVPRPVEAGLAELQQPATMVLGVWDSGDSSRFHRRDLMLGLADGTLWLMRDAKTAGLPSLAVMERLMTADGTQATVPGDACIGLLPRADNAAPWILAGASDGRIHRFARSEFSDTPSVQQDAPIATAAGELILAHPCPVGTFWDSDIWPDLIVGTADGQLTLYRGTSSEGVFEDAAPLLNETLPGGPPLVPRIVDWDDDGHRDILVGSGDGYIYWVRNIASVPGTWRASAPTRLTLEGDKLRFTGGAAIEGFDIDGVDCAKDLRVIDGEGNIWHVHGHVDTAAAPIPRYPLGATELTEDGQSFHEGFARPRWTLPDGISNKMGRLRLELSKHADFNGGYEVVLLPEDGFSMDMPSELDDLPAISVEERRYWRVRWESAKGTPGAWSSINSYSYPAPGLNPVDGESVTLQDGRTRLADVDHTNFTYAKVADATDGGVLATEAFEVLSEHSTADGYRLRWQFDLDLLPLGGANHIALKFVGKSDGSEKFDLLAWTGGQWRYLTETPNEGLGTVIADLTPDDVHNGRVSILVEDRNADEIQSKLYIDQIALLDLNHPPIADAGPNAVAKSGEVVQLDATGSSDPDDDPLTFSWTQTAGTEALIDEGDTATPRVTAPAVNGDEVLSFRVQVFDGTTFTLDEVTVLVDNRDRAIAKIVPNISSERPVFVTEGATDVVMFDATVDFAGEITHLFRQATFDVQGHAQLISSFRLVAISDESERVLGEGTVSGSRLVFRNMSRTLNIEDQMRIMVLADTRHAEASQGSLWLLPLLLLSALGLGLGGAQRRLRWLWLLPMLLGAISPITACTHSTPGYVAPHTVAISLRDTDSLRIEDIETGVTAVLDGLPIAGPTVNIETGVE